MISIVSQYMSSLKRIAMTAKKPQRDRYYVPLEYERALEQFLNSLEIAKESNIEHLIAMSHMNIGICYDELKEYKKASQHLNLDLEIFEKIKT